jgi:transposase-like protein
LNRKGAKTQRNSALCRPKISLRFFGGCKVNCVKVKKSPKVYQASTKELAEQQLDALDQKWGKKYPLVINSWKNNWNKLSTYFKYDPTIRKLIYTTNTIQGFYRQVRPL